MGAYEEGWYYDKVREQAAEIERLKTARDHINRALEQAQARLNSRELQIGPLLTALKGIAEYCSGDGQPLGAIERLAAVRNTAERAVATLGQS